jgi:Invasion protein B, involved in pathogenesis
MFFSDGILNFMVRICHHIRRHQAAFCWMVAAGCALASPAYSQNAGNEQPAPQTQPTEIPTLSSPSAQTFGDWTYRCEKLPGALVEQCRMEQFVVDEQRPNVSLVVMIFRTADGKNLFMRIVTPLGLILPTGIRLGVDGQTLPMTLPYTQCFNIGCMAELLDNQLIENLKVAKTLHIIVWPSPEDPIGVPLSLKGYAEAFQKL